MTPEQIDAELALLDRLRQGDPTLTHDERQRARAFDTTDHHTRRFWTGFVHRDTWHPPRPIGLAIAWLLFVILPCAAFVTVGAILISGC